MPPEGRSSHVLQLAVVPRDLRRGVVREIRRDRRVRERARVLPVRAGL